LEYTQVDARWLKVEILTNTLDACQFPEDFPRRAGWPPSSSDITISFKCRKTASKLAFEPGMAFANNFELGFWIWADSNADFLNLGKK
jgi:hypothetical protein